MENQKSTIRLFSFTYGKGVYITILCLAACSFIIGAFLLPNIEGIAMLLVGLFFVALSFCLIYFKYLNCVTLTHKNVATKRQSFSWDNVFLTMSLYAVHTTIRREDYYIFFDDHYLDKEEIYSHKIKSNAFYIMVTPERLELILKMYSKKIQLLERSRIDKKGLYDQVNEYNQMLENCETKI